MAVELKAERISEFVGESEIKGELEAAKGHLRSILHDPQTDAGVKGWLDGPVDGREVDDILSIAEEIRREADVFVLIGVGGSNQAARAILKALDDRLSGPEIIYAGNTLSAVEISRMLHRLEGKSVYIQVIAKNFETLEPGSHYRILRQALKSRYSGKELAKRTILTGTPGASLEAIARREGCRFLKFPSPVGGRYSAFTAVGLLPIAVAGLDIMAYLEGRTIMARVLEGKEEDNPVLMYAALRNILFRKGYGVEMLASFEPDLFYFAKWWWQLFGESEGKDKTGILPAMAVYSEDLHSIGQYLQDGQRFMMETFLHVKNSGKSVVLLPDPDFRDGFDYLDNKDFSEINHIAEQATIKAHQDGGVPCLQIRVDRLDEQHLGQLFYFFMIACAVSGKLTGVNPFDQEGVEEYKKSMFSSLGR